MSHPAAQTALLVIDVQEGLFHKSTPIYGGASLVAHVNQLVTQAHADGAPVYWVRHADKRTLVPGSPEWQLHHDLHPAPDDHFVEKTHPNAFEGTTLDEQLHEQGVTRLVVAGLVTHGCVRASCLGAGRLGYTVTLASDAHSSYNQDAAGLIAEWNQKLGVQGIDVRPSAEIAFS
jgi:nicotinamidase-related amidase